jgi:hypothetical protein
MATGDRFVTLIGLAQFDFPGRTVQLTDGGPGKLDGVSFIPADDVFGAIAKADAIEEAVGDSAPDGGISLFVPQETALATVFDPALQNSRVQFWLGEITPSTGEVSNEQRLFDGLVDQVSWDPIERRLDMTLMARAERLFVVNRGNVAGSAFHKSVWPGEQGFDNCTDARFQKAWGTAGPPRGVTSGGGAGGIGGAGAGGGGRTLFVSAAV